MAATRELLRVLAEAASAEQSYADVEQRSGEAYAAGDEEAWMALAREANTARQVRDVAQAEVEQVRQTLAGLLGAA